MEIGLGVLRWTPAAFWSATPHELLAGLDGYAAAHGGKRKSAPIWTDEDDVALEEMMRRFPD